MPSGDEIRESQRAVWDGLSGAWERWAPVIVEQLRPVGEAMIARLGIAEDQRHLDVAAGTGEPGLTIAQRAPRGRVVLTDLAPEMLAVAVRRAGALGVTNVETRVCSADDLPFGDAVFDSASVRFGYMFLPDPAAATAELVRVLRPGGRVCAAVWARPEDNPWTTIGTEAIPPDARPPAPGPGEPGIFRCAAPGFVAALFQAAGLREVDEWDVPVELVTESPAEYWQVVSEHVAPVATSLGRLDEAGRARAAGVAIRAAAAYESGGRTRVPGLARCTVGTR